MYRYIRIYICIYVYIYIYIYIYLKYKEFENKIDKNACNSAGKKLAKSFIAELCQKQKKPYLKPKFSVPSKRACQITTKHEI